MSTPVERQKVPNCIFLTDRSFPCFDDLNKSPRRTPLGLSRQANREAAPNDDGRSNPNPLHFVQGDLIACAVVELGGAR